MKKIIKFVSILAVTAVMLVFGGLLADQSQLRENILRLHVVADSDSVQDQAIKLQVRDVVLVYLKPVMDQVKDKETALSYIRLHISQLETVANSVLSQAGFADTAKVSLKKECFDTRNYDTFSLPAGVYDSLRITIGSGSGKNWWCVVFPTFCMDAAGTALEDTAVAAGINETLADTIQREDRYEIRFFLLDCLGKIENFFFKA